MKKFLCTFELPGSMDDTFWEQIPFHRRYVNELMRDEKIVTYSVNQERSRGWVVINAVNERQARMLIDGFPIRQHISIQLDELFIFDSMIGSPKLIFN